MREPRQRARWRAGWKGDLTWRQLSRRVWSELARHDVFGRAAQLSYFFLLSLFPLLIILTVLLGFVAHGGSILESMLAYLEQVLPPAAFILIRKTLLQITSSAGGGKLSIGILVTLWFASNGMWALIGGIHAAYEIQDERPWWKVQIIAVALTIAFAVLIISALVLALVGQHLGALLAYQTGWGPALMTVWTIIQWPLVILFVLIAVSLLYRYAPDVRVQKWRWVIPGATVAVACWLAVIWGFRAYLHFFNTYSEFYGSLGAVIILLLWLYLTGAVILAGAEVNSEIEHAAALAGHPKAKRNGEKYPGQFIS